MTDEKRISVIVPVYNIGDYIDKCVESLISQTYPNLEIILVDDGSTDGSGEICDRYAVQDARIIVLHKENGGLSDARNYALDRAHGDLMAFVDGDDWIHPQMYEMMIGTMELQHADVVTCWFEQKNEEFAKKQYQRDELHVKLLTGAEALVDIETPLVVAWNKLYKKDIFDDIRYPKGKLHEDEYVIHRIFYKCRKVAVIEESLYFYTIRGGSIVSQMTPGRIDDSLEAFTDRVEFSYSKGWAEVIPAVVKRYCDYCIGRFMDIRNDKYEQIDKSYLDILWQSEHDMLQKHSDVEIDERYRRFAVSPDAYDRWIVYIARRSRLRSLPRAVLRRIAGILGFKK